MSILGSSSESVSSLKISNVSTGTSSNLLIYNSSTTAVEQRLTSTLLEMNMGEIYIYNNATETTVTVQGDFYPISGTWVNDLSMNFSLVSSTRLQYDGMENLTYHCGATFDIEPSSGVNVLFEGKLYKNGTAINSGVANIISSAGRPNSTALHCFTSLSNGDYLELRIANLDNTVNFIVKNANLFSVHNHIP